MPSVGYSSNILKLVSYLDLDALNIDYIQMEENIAPQ